MKGASVAKKKKRKTRITKKEVERIKDYNKLTSAQSKKLIKPGPWTELDTKLKVNVSLRENKTVMVESLGPCYGNYTKDELWGEKGWYAIVFNIEVDNIKELVNEHGMDQFLAASEKSLSAKLDAAGKARYGKLIITTMCVDNSQRETKPRFVSCRGKTNKKSIKGFRAIRKKVLVTIE